MTNEDFKNNDKDNPFTFPSNKYTFERSKNTLDGPTTGIGGRVRMSISKLDKNGDEHSVFLPRQDFSGLSKEVALPEDGSSLKINLLSYYKKDEQSFYPEGYKVYYATAFKSGAAVLTNKEFKNNDKDSPFTFPSNKFTFERSKNSLDGLPTGIGGKVRIKIVKLNNTGGDSTIVLKLEEFSGLSKEVDLPEDGSSLKIYLVSYYKKDEQSFYPEGYKVYYATAWTRPKAARLTNVNYFSDTFSSFFYNFRRTRNTFDGQTTGDGGKVKMKIVKIVNNKEEVFSEIDFTNLEKKILLPHDGSKLRIYLNSYDKKNKIPKYGTVIYNYLTSYRDDGLPAKLTNPYFADGKTPKLKSGTSYTFNRTNNTLNSQNDGVVKYILIKEKTNDYEMQRSIFSGKNITHTFESNVKSIKISIESYIINDSVETLIHTETYYATIIKPGAAELTNVAFRDFTNKPTFDSNKYTFNRSMNTLNAQNNGKVEIKIVKAQSDGEDGDVVFEGDFSGLTKEITNLPEDGSSLKIYLYSYDENDDIYTKGTIIYKAYAWFHQKGAEFTNGGLKDSTNKENPYTFPSNKFTFERSKNTLDGSNAANEGKVEIKIVKLSESGEDRDIVLDQVYPDLSLVVDDLPEDGSNLKIYLNSYYYSDSYYPPSKGRKSYYAKAWTRPEAAELTNDDFENNKRFSHYTFTSGSYTFERSKNTLDGQIDDKGGKVKITIFKLQSNGFDGEVVVEEDDFSDLSKEITNLPKDGSTLRIYLYSYDKNNKKHPKGTKSYFAKATSKPGAAELKNYDFYRDESHTFGTKIYTFRRTRNTLDGQTTGNGGKVKIKIAKIDSDDNEVDVVLEEDFSGLTKRITTLPGDSTRLKIELFSYDKSKNNIHPDGTKTYFAKDWTRPEAAELTNDDFENNKRFSHYTFTSGSYTFERSKNTLDGQIDDKGGKVKIKIFKLQSNGFDGEVVVEEDDFSDLSKEITNLPKDGSTLRIYLYSYDKNNKKHPKGTKSYFAKATTKPGAAELKNYDFYRDESHTFGTKIYTFRRTRNTLDGQTTGNGGKVKIKIAKIDSDDNEVDVVLEEDFSGLTKRITTLPGDSTRLKIELFSYDKSKNNIHPDGTKTYFAKDWTRPEAAELTNDDFENNKRFSHYTFTSGSYTFERSKNTLDGQIDDKGGKVKIKIFKLQSNGFDGEVVVEEDDFSDLSKEITNLPKDGSTLRIYLYSYDKNNKKHPDGTKTYFATTTSKPGAAKLK